MSEEHEYSERDLDEAETLRRILAGLGIDLETYLASTTPEAPPASKSRQADIMFSMSQAAGASQYVRRVLEQEAALLDAQAEMEEVLGEDKSAG